MGKLTPKTDRSQVGWTTLFCPPKPGRVGIAFLPTKDKVSVIAFRMHDAMTDTLFGGKPKICLFNGFRYLGVPEELILIPASAQNNAENGSQVG